VVKRKTIEEYVEVIYLLEEEEGRAQTGRIASEMRVRPSSATEMLQKLQEEGLLRYETYSGANLTPAGQRLARDLRRSHGVIADFLEIIGVDKDVADADACQMEHHVSRESVEQLQKFVKFAEGTISDPEWRENFRKFCRTGGLLTCNSFSKKE
jgi:DtxR family Mn-dependent transcriptional regulator